MAQSKAERQRALRARDRARGVKQVNIRVPEIYDVMLNVLAADLRRGMRLEGLSCET